jgi:phosphate transport system permease protein
MAIRVTRANAAARRIKARLYHGMLIGATLVGIVVLATLLVRIFITGLPGLDWDFITSFPSRFASRAGILSAIMGTVWVMAFTALFTFPLGVGTAIYLEEYAPKNRITDIIQTNISNLAGVPSIVYGILGLTVFVRWLALDRSVIAGALTMTLLILPISIIASREAIRSVPMSLRQASFALGATQWQTIWNIVLPRAFPGILTGTILSMSRAIGETAPLIMIGALTFVAFVPTSPMDPFTALPIQIFNWASRPQSEFLDIAATASIVLLIVLVLMNGTAIYLRNKFQSRAED